MRLIFRIALSAAAILIFAAPVFAERWKIQYFFDEDRSRLVIEDLVFPSEKRGIAMGTIVKEGDNKQKFTTLVTSDGGENWTQIPQKEHGRSLFFLNDSDGWMVTDDSIWFALRRRSDSVLTRWTSRIEAALASSVIRPRSASCGNRNRNVALIAVTLAERCVDARFSRIKIDRDPLRGQPTIVVREVFKFAWRQAGWGEQSMGFDEWQQLANLASGEDPRMFNLPGGRRAQRDGEFVVLGLLMGWPGFP